MENDLISRSALLKKAQALLSFDGKEVVWVRDDVLLAPTIDAVTVVHGRWIRSKVAHYNCSICNFTAGGVTYPYCPNCGARMDAEEAQHV